MRPAATFPGTRNRPRPHDLADPVPDATAERALLGAMLWSHAAIDTATGIVSAEDFADPAHQAVFHAVVVTARAGRPVATSTVADQLRVDGLLDLAGGIEALVSLQAEAAVSVSAAPHYGAIVAEQAQRRRIRASALELAEATLDPATSPARLAELAASIGAGAPRTHEPFPVVAVHELLANPVPKPPVLVDWLLRQGEMLVLAAARSVGKTWACQSLALHLADGYGRWLDTFAVKRETKVLYWHGEAASWSVQDRWAKLVGENDTMAPRIVDCYHPTRLRIAEARSWLADGTQLTSYRAIIDPGFEAMLDQARPDVFVIDPWSSFYGGNENDNAAVSAAVDELWRLCSRYGASLVVAHHFSKASDTREPEDLWRGASRLADAAHTRITLLPYYTPTTAKQLGLDRHQARRHARVTFLRRNDPIHDDITVRWDPDTGLWKAWNDPNAPDDAVDYQAAMRRQRSDGELRSVVEAAHRQKGGFQTLLAAQAALGCGREKAERLLEAAVQAGLLIVIEGTKRGEKAWSLNIEE